MEIRLEPPEGESGWSYELLVKVGDLIEPGQHIANVISGSVEQEIEAYEQGRIVAIVRTIEGYLLKVEERD